jgi:hypothetical protein
MADAHVELTWWTSNAGNDSPAGVVVVDHAVEDILIVVRIDVIIVEVSWLSIGEVIVWMGSREAQRREECWENVKDDEHCRVHDQMQEDARPN